MPPIFREKDFDYKNRDEIPDHVEGLPEQKPDAYPTGYRIEEHDNSGRTEILAADIDSADDAASLLFARRALVGSRKREIFLRDGSGAIKLDVRPVIVASKPQTIELTNTPNPRHGLDEFTKS